MESLDDYCKWKTYPPSTTTGPYEEPKMSDKDRKLMNAIIFGDYPPEEKLKFASMISEDRPLNIAIYQAGLPSDIKFLMTEYYRDSSWCLGHAMQEPGFSQQQRYSLCERLESSVAADNSLYQAIVVVPDLNSTQRYALAKKLRYPGYIQQAIADAPGLRYEQKLVLASQLKDSDLYMAVLTVTEFSQEDRFALLLGINNPQLIYSVLNNDAIAIQHRNYQDLSFLNPSQRRMLEKKLG
jgi:hypothetical protein